MQQVGGAQTVVARPREQAVVAEQIVVKKGVDPWMLAVPLIVLLAWGAIVTWIGIIVFLAQGADWMANAWQWR